MMTSKFKKAAFTNRFIKNRKKKNCSEWKFVDISKKERLGKTIEQLDELRKKKYADQVKKMEVMAKIAEENNMTRLYRNAVKEKKKKMNQKK